MFNSEIQDFLDRNDACSDGINRLQDRGVETLEQAWEARAMAAMAEAQAKWVRENFKLQDLHTK